MASSKKPQDTTKLIEVDFDYVTGEYGDSGELFRKEKLLYEDTPNDNLDCSLTQARRQGGGRPCQKGDALSVDQKKRSMEARSATTDILHVRIATTNMAVQTARSVENL